MSKPFFTRPNFWDRDVVQYSGTSITLSGETNISQSGYFRIQKDATPSYVATCLDTGGTVVWMASSGGGTFTGNTSASCITDLYVTNIHGCSPITVWDSIQSVGSSSSGMMTFSLGKYNSVDFYSNYSSTIGGRQNKITGSTYSSINGGIYNFISDGRGSNIAGGGYNSIIGISGNYSFIGGGLDNIISGSSIYSSVGGGRGNSIKNSKHSIIGGGLNNSIYEVPTTGLYNSNVIVGGVGNKIINEYSPYVSAQSSFIGGGVRNYIKSDYWPSWYYSTSSIVGGRGNSVRGAYASIVGGFYNTVNGSNSAIAGGSNNLLGGWRSFIGAGQYNKVYSTASVVGGSYNFIQAGGDNFIGHGSFNRINSGSGNSIIGGVHNVCEGVNVHILGSYITGTTDNTVYTPKIISVNANGVNTNEPSAAGLISDFTHYNELKSDKTTSGLVYSNFNVTTPKNLPNNSVAGFVGSVGLTFWNRDTAFNLNTNTGASALTGLDGASVVSASGGIVGRILGVRSTIASTLSGVHIDNASFYHCNNPDTSEPFLNGIYGIKNIYGFRMEPISTTSNGYTANTTNIWGVLIEDINSKNYFAGTVGIGDSTETPTSTLDINGVSGSTQLRLRKSYTPTSTSDTNGNIGDIAWDNNYIYVKTNTGWGRTLLDYAF